MPEELIDFFVNGPGEIVWILFQGSFNAAYPADTPWPDDLTGVMGATD